MSEPNPKLKSRDILDIGKEVLRREGQALTDMADALGSAFSDVVELLEASPGRVVVTGVGKSGQVGSKIAATLTSTGTLAFFLHPTEALHGDLGIVTKDDVVLAISKSGRTAELLQLLPHFHRLGAPVVAMVQDTSSPLAEHSRLVLPLVAFEEACSLDLVPTTSTTLFMALGDALAVTLFRRRGLTQEDFAFVHPGGLIGRQLGRRVSDLMHSGDRFPFVKASASLREALLQIMEKGLGITTVLDGESLVGVVTDGDLKRILLRHEALEFLDQPVTQFMSKNPRTIEPSNLVATAVRRMEEKNPGAVTSLVVIENAKPMGILHLHDCLRVDLG
ncbi:MAG: KpsF/GutQ family sugar-phosphate isomerase [Candidatus Eisenbacteria bacterium]|uniref:KpsF/GutQ family sugar-phosphate isomerase n=1 Tax=Eiseniibacteriota bacterium TaxID=2212470 RepID=A0A7Y2H1D0_UNCEI|nr:KpsF/GutQ family sugar-phosphate isomerase [Candidatus Eisenbacteria bacterium]